LNIFEFDSLMSWPIADSDRHQRFTTGFCLLLLIAID
jgi:hypothetical protein